MPTSSRIAHVKKNWTLYLSALFLLALLGSYYFIPPFREFLNTFWEVIWSKDEQRNAEFFRNHGAVGALLIILLMVLQMFLIIFPSWLPMIAAVLGFGPYWGFLISVVAVFCASSVGYLLGEQFSGPAKDHLVRGKTYEKISNLLQENGFGIVILFRISPFLSNDAISIIAGIMNMGYRRYILATLAGIIPLAAAIAYFGRDTESLKSGLYWIGGVGLLLYGGYVYLKKKGKKQD